MVSILCMQLRKMLKNMVVSTLCFFFATRKNSFENNKMRSPYLYANESFRRVYFPAFFFNILFYSIYFLVLFVYMYLNATFHLKMLVLCVIVWFSRKTKFNCEIFGLFSVNWTFWVVVRLNFSRSW